MQQQMAGISYEIVWTGCPVIQNQTDVNANNEIANTKINIGKKFLARVQNVQEKMVYVLFLYCNSVGHYGWKMINGVSFPYVVRKINGKFVHFTPVRHVNTLIKRNKYFDVINKDILETGNHVMNTIPINMTEMNLLNRIVQRSKSHKSSKTNEDLIAKTDEVVKYYKFL